MLPTLKINGISLDSIKNLKKISQKIIVNKYFTYLVAVLTLVFVSETLQNENSEILLSLKSLFDNLVIKFLFLIGAIGIGYYNQTLGILLVINFFFLINIQEKIEFFVSNFPNLIDKNKVLKYQKNFKNHKVIDTKKSSSNKEDKESNKEDKETNNEEKESNNKEDKETNNEDKETNKEDKESNIDNPIRIKESEELHDNVDITSEQAKEIDTNVKEEVEEVINDIKNDKLSLKDMDPNKKKLYQKYYKLHQSNSKKEKDDIHLAENGDKSIENKESLTEYNLRNKKNKKNKEDLIQELQKTEIKNIEEERLRKSEDDTLESEIKSKKIESKRNLKILEETDDEEDSSSSDSSGSSSSESSSESEKEYEDVSLSEAREHVLKKLRNKMKKEYATNT